MKHDKIKGLIAAPYTPFHKNGHLNLDIIRTYAGLLQKSKLSGAFIGGTTGEGMLMTTAERKALSEEWIKYQSDTFKIIVHVGANSYLDSQELARHAATLGADAISSMGPLFLRPENVDDLISYCREITIAAEDLPFYYYHIPGISGVKFPMIEFLEKSESRLPSLAGIKYTDSNLMDLQLCHRSSEGRWDILYGQDETLLSGWSLGLQGAVGSTYNYMAPLYHQVIDAYERGDIERARQLQHFSARYVRLLIHYGGGVIGGKPLMKWIGLDCGPLRTPAHNLSGREVSEFYKKIQEMGIHKYFSVEMSMVL